jgi:hypothetical protein
MAMKGGVVKLEIIHICEVISSSKSKMGSQYGLASLNMYIVQKIKDNI